MINSIWYKITDSTNKKFNKYNLISGLDKDVHVCYILYIHLNHHFIMKHTYIKNTKLTDADLTYYTGKISMQFDVEQLITAATNTNTDIRRQYEDTHKYTASLLRNIPMKNLSGAVGECYGQHLALITGNLKKNPHEAGAPDFLPITEVSKPWFENPTQKYFHDGGFDTKASYSPNKEFSKVSASSHHNQTSTVLVIQWTFSTDMIPEVIGVFYTNKLIPTDWKLSVGKPGSKTTNAAAMTSTGKDKLRKGWIILRDDMKLPQRKIKEEYGL